MLWRPGWPQRSRVRKGQQRRQASTKSGNSARLQPLWRSMAQHAAQHSFIQAALHWNYLPRNVPPSSTVSLCSTCVSQLLGAGWQPLDLEAWLPTRNIVQRRTTSPRSNAQCRSGSVAVAAPPGPSYPNPERDKALEPRRLSASSIPHLGMLLLCFFFCFARLFQHPTKYVYRPPPDTHLSFANSCVGVLAEPAGARTNGQPSQPHTHTHNAHVVQALPQQVALRTGSLPPCASLAAAGWQAKSQQGPGAHGHGNCPACSREASEEAGLAAKRLFKYICSCQRNVPNHR